MTFLRERFLSTVAGQLGRPHGVLSPFVARALNRGNEKAIVAAVDAAQAPRGGVAADIGFGGGVGLRLSRGSLTALPLEDGSVDALITVNTVYFISELDAACRELTRVLRQGGRVVIGIGDPEVMARLPFTKHGFTIRPVGEIAAALQDSGLQVEQRRIEDKPIPRYLLIGTRD
jgi:SAM-dependent methyltransferase